MTSSKAFVNYLLLKDIKRAFNARVFEDIGVVSEDEDRHVSELERRVTAFDDKETYITVKTLYATHKETFMRTLAYINKEGERDATD